MLRLYSHLKKWEISKRYFTLSLCASPLIGSYFFGYTEVSSPLQCLFLATTGIPCPGCGLTRSFMAVAHNNLIEALNYHVLGPFLFFALLLTCIHLILELLLRRSIVTFYVKLLRNRTAQMSFLGMLLSYHCFRLYLLFLSGELVSSFKDSPLGNFI